MDKITIGDYVKHKYLSWQDKLKVISINFQTYTLHTSSGFTIHYNIADLEPWIDTDTTILSIVDPLYCNCSYSDRNIVKSSIQVQGSVEETDNFKYCRTCKKELK